MSIIAFYRVLQLSEISGPINKLQSGFHFPPFSGNIYPLAEVDYPHFCRPNVGLSGGA